VLAETGASRVDVVAYEAGGFAAADWCDRLGGGHVRRLVFVATPWLGWDLADAVVQSLVEDLGSADPAVVARAAARLAEDAGLLDLTGPGADAFRRSHRGPAAAPDAEIWLLAARRPPEDGDDEMSVATALGLMGPNVRTAVHETVTVPPSLHRGLTSDVGFLEALLIPALEGLSPTASLSAVRSTSARHVVMSRGVVGSALRLSGEEGDEGPEGKLECEVTVSEGAEEATFEGFSTDGDVEVSVVDPDGEVVTAGSAASDSNVSESSGSSADGSSLGKITITDPEPGTYTLQLSSTAPMSETTVVGKFSEASPLDVSLVVDTFVRRPGDPVQVRVVVKPAEAAVSGGTMQLVGPDGSRFEAALLDDGVAPDAAAGDQDFAAVITVPVSASSVGRWIAAAQVVGDYRGSEFDRSGALLLDVAGDAASAVGPYSAELTKPDGSGQFEALAVEVGVEVASAGSYLVTGRLRAPDGTQAGEATTTLSASSPGQKRVTLEFDARDMAAAGAPGKFVVAEVVVTDQTGAATIVDQETDVLETDSIPLELLATDTTPSLSFLAPGAGLLPVRSSFLLRWEDSDPDSDASIALFLDDDDSGLDGIPIPGAGALSEDDAADAFALDVSELEEGDWFVYAVISDEASSVARYASAPIPVALDSDGDGLTDAYELAFGLDAERHDSASDLDADGLTNAEEAVLGSSPALADSDGGGENDGREVENGRDPTDGTDDVAVAPGTLLGDLSPAGGDGRVSVRDAVALRLLLDSPSPPSAAELLLMDVAPSVVFDANATPPLHVRVGDGRLDELDVDGLVQQVLGAHDLVEAP
jgi:hypothetical protein